MADLERLKRALQAAHAAGDTAAATQLAQAIRAAQAAPATPQYDSFGDLVKQRGQQFAQGATEAFASIPEAVAISGAGNPNAGANVVSETVQKAQADLAALDSDYQERLAAYKEANREPPAELVQRYKDQRRELVLTIDGTVVRGDNQSARVSNREYLETVTNGGEVNLKPDAQDRDLFKAGDTLRKSSEDVFGAPQPNDQSFWGQVAQGGGTVAGMIAQGPFALAGGSAMNSSQLYKEARDAGATEEDAKRAAELGAWVGTTEIIPINRALKLLPPRLRKEVGSKFWKKVSDIAQSSGEEAAQEYAQTVANNLIAQNIYDPERGWNEGAAESALVGAVIGGGVGTIGVTINNSLYTDEGSLKKPEDLDSTQQQAAGDLARTFKAITFTNPDWNLKDVDKTSATGARAVVDTAHVQLTEALKQRFADMKSRVKPNQADTFESVSEKIMAQAAYREGRNKTKNLVGNQELDALRSLAGDTKEGQEAINLILQLNQLTELHNSGYQGGLSTFTDQFSLFGSKVGYDKGAVATERLLRPLLTGGAALQTGGLSLLGQAAASQGGRAIDKLTGNYSQIDKFVRRNAETPGLPTPMAPSLRDAAAAQLQADEDAKLREEALRTVREAEQRALNLQLVQEGAPATPGSPQYTLEDATGLSRDGVARILRILKAQNKNPALTRAIADYEQSVATGGIVEDKMLSPLIRAVRQFQEQNPDYVPMVRPPNSLSSPMLAAAAAPGQVPAVSTAEASPVQEQTFGPQLTTPENYNRGIEANTAANRELVEGVVTDPQLNRVQKGRLITALDNLNTNLGSDPVAAAQEQVQKLEDSGVPQEAIDAYVKPYVDRVMQQQVSRQFMPKTEGPRGLAAAQAAGVAPTVETQAPVQPEVRTEASANLADMKDIVRPIPDGTNDVEAPRKQLALPLFETPLVIKGKPTVRKIGEAMNQDHMDKVGRQLFPENTPEDYTQVLGFAEEELIEQLKQPNSGVGWYSKDVDESMRLASKVFPTLKDNQEHRQLYLTFAGIFSNGSDPDNAFIMSSWAFEDFLRTGKIPVNRAEGFYEQGLEPPKTTFKETKTGKMVTKDAGWGIRNQANEQQLGMLRYLVEREGSLKGAMDFLLTPQKRSDINDVMLESGLYKEGRFKTQKEKTGPDEFGFLAFGKKLGRYSLGLHGVEIDAGDTTIDLWYTRTYRRWTGRLLETPIGKEGVAAQPANDTERDVIFKITGELAKKYDLPVGDVQALLWFFEKRTWGAQGLNTKEGTNSSGARKLLRERGIDPDAADDGTGSNGTDPQAGPTTEQPRLSAAPTGVAGILAQRMGQESGPREGRNTPPAKPSTQEVKLTSKPVKGAMSVGKPGTETENGIKDMKQLSYLAEAWDIALNIYDDHAQMLKDSGVDNGEGTTTYGVYDPKTRTASILRAGAKPIDGGAFQTEFESFITTLHEVAHGITESAPDGSRIKYASSNVKAGFNFINKTPEFSKIGSLEEKIMDVLSLPTAIRNAIYKELRDLQDKGLRVSDEGEQLLVREYGRAMEILKERNDPELRRQWKGPIQGVFNYIRSTPEFAVDAMISYLHNPKKFKKQAPKTAKMMRDFFNKSGKLTLYAHPLPMAVAVIIAMLMKRDEDEEREKQQQAAMMPPGALNQPMAPGMLSAQQA